MAYALHLSRATFDSAEPAGLEQLRARLSPSSLERRRRLARCEALLGRRLPRATLRGRPVRLHVDPGRPFSKADHLRFLLQDGAWEEAQRGRLELREQFCANAADLIRALVATPAPPQHPGGGAGRVGGARPQSPRAPLFAALCALWASMAQEGDVEGVARWRAATGGGAARGEAAPPTRARLGAAGAALLRHGGGIMFPMALLVG